MAVLLRLSYFVVERAAEPLSQRLEQAAASSARFRSFCVTCANWYNDIDYHRSVRRVAHEQRMAARADLGTPTPGRGQWVPVDDLPDRPLLTEREAVQQGTELLGEAFVLSVGLALLLHQTAADRAAEAEQQQLVEENETRIKALEETQQELRLELRAQELRPASLYAYGYEVHSVVPLTLPYP